MAVARAVDRFRPVLAVLSGLLLAAAFPNLNLPWVAWLAPGLTVLLGAGQSPRAVFCLGLLAGLGRYLASLYWFLLIPMRFYAVLAWISMCVVLSLFVATWCWLCWRYAPRGAASAPLTAVTARAMIAWTAFCASAWVAMEMGFAHVLTGFPWALLGTSQYRVLPLIQVASLTGVYGVSFLVLWTSVSTVFALWHAWRAAGTQRLGLALLAPPLLALLGVWAFGQKRLAQPLPVEPRVTIALVQPSTPQQIIWDPNERTNRLNHLLELSHQALSEPADLLVWPEAALPGTLARTRETQELVTRLVRAHNVWMIFGAEDSGRRTAPNGAEVTDRLNGAFLVSPAGELVSRYHKRHLVAFGEFMPGAGWLPFLARFRQEGGGFARGRGPVTFRLDHPAIRISPLICFEDVFPHLAREHVSEDTEILLNLTNNGWFGESAAQWQHAATAVFRAVENGVPLVRCTNNGLTCWADPRGRLHEVYFPGSRDIYQPGVKIARVPYAGGSQSGNRTFYHRFGDWFGWTCVAVTAAACLGSFPLFKRRRL